MNIIKSFLTLVFLNFAAATFAQVKKVQTLQLTGGTPGVGKVLISDPNGVASWENTSGFEDTVVSLSTTAVSPIHSITGKVWMDRNLGASRRAQHEWDNRAYGQLYQWGRGNDGHADIIWTSYYNGIPVNGTTFTLSTTDYPDNNMFISIQSQSQSQDWRVTQNDNLWQGVAGVNNPCPIGYRIPTKTELFNEATAYGFNNGSYVFDCPLRLVLPGYRSGYLGWLTDESIFGSYWSSTVYGNHVLVLMIRGVEVFFGDTFRSNALSVRCIKD